MSTGSCIIEAGRLVRNEVRMLLDKRKFLRGDVDYIENKGFWSSEFVIRGDYEFLATLKRVIQERS
jgi:hypothetical protein